MAEGINLVGVDIGASSIKVVQLKEKRRKLEAIRYGFAPLPPQTVVDGHVLNSSLVTEALARLFHDNKIRERDVAISVYGQSVIVRKITVPLMSAKELQQQINWEAEQHIPFDIKLMSIDYEVLKMRPEAGQMDLLLVAAKRDEVNDFAAILRNAKLRPIVVDVNAFTMQNAFERQIGFPNQETIALVNIGAAVTTVDVVSQGIGTFTREIGVAGASITDEIRKQCNISFDEAEAFKCAHERSPTMPNEVPSIILQGCVALAAELKRALDFYIATSGETGISKIHICGGSAYLAPLGPAIEQHTNVPVALFDPLIGVDIDGKFADEVDMRSRAAQLVVAMGLSLRYSKERRQWSA